jgi:23S rRNA pseudouridine1911/1915/1917 synthase
MDEVSPSFVVQTTEAGKRLDAFLVEKIVNLSRARIQFLIEGGCVLVNGQTAKCSSKVREGDVIEVKFVDFPTDDFTPEDIPLDIVFEDNEIAVINKPAGMVVHPAAGIHGGTLANAIAFHFKLQITDSKFQNRVGIVHRLDKETSGLVVVAKTDAAHENLSDQFRNREVYKSYLALVHGVTRENSGRIEEPIARDLRNRLRMTITKKGRNALTLWKVKERFERFTLLNVEIKTGRTHQIRVHLAHIKHPVVGDETYNQGRDKTVPDARLRAEIGKLGRFFLHAEKLYFKHPKSGEYLKFQTPLPSELENFRSYLK